jgi:hypothetical protein
VTGAAAPGVALPALANGFAYDDVRLVRDPRPGSLPALFTSTF